MIFIIISTLIYAKKQISIKERNENSVFMVFISTSGFFLTPLNPNIPKKVKDAIIKMCGNYDEFSTAHDIYLQCSDGLSDYYKILMRPVGFGIIQCSAFHVVSLAMDVPSKMMTPGTIYSILNDDRRYKIEAEVQYSENLEPSASFRFKVDRQPCIVTIRQHDKNKLTLGRQSMEISRFLGIHYELYKKAIAAKPSFSFFIAWMKESYMRLNYKALAVYIVENEIAKPVVFYCSPELKDDVEKAVARVAKGEIEVTDDMNRDMGTVRIGMHMLTMEDTKYLMLIASDISGAILRSLFVVIHSIVSLIIIHNHTHLCGRELSIDYDHVEHVCNAGRRMAVFETINGELTWSNGYLYGRKFDKNMFEMIKLRLFSALELEVNESKSIISPMWESPSDHRMIAVVARKNIDKLRKVPIITYIVTDVTDPYSSGIFDNSSLLTSSLGGVMYKMSRVVNNIIEVPSTIKSYFGEIPSSSFTALTYTTDKILYEKIQKIPKMNLTMIKSNGSPMLASSVPIGESGEFIFYPERSLMKALPKIIGSCFTKDDAKKSITRLTFFDISRDTYQETRNYSYPPLSFFWKFPEELSDCPKIRRHLANMSGIFIKREVFLKCINDAIKTGRSNALTLIYEENRGSQYLIHCQFQRSVLAVVMIPLNEENMITGRAIMVMHAMDGVNSTGHIFVYRFQKNMTDDGVFTSPPCGLYPINFSINSFRHVMLPAHINEITRQIETGKVEMAILLKYDIPRWYIDLGQIIEGGEFRGVCIQAPLNAFTERNLNPKKIVQSTNNLYTCFEGFKNYFKDIDISEFEEAVQNVKKSAGSL